MSYNLKSWCNFHGINWNRLNSKGRIAVINNMERYHAENPPIEIALKRKYVG